MKVITNFARTTRHFCHIPTGQISNRLFDLVGKLEIDRDSLAWFLALGFVPGEKTLFKDIVCLPGGAEIEVEPGSYRVVRSQKYQDLLTDEFLLLDEEVLVDEGIHRWQRTISSKYNQQNGKIVVPISGGLDSRAILAALLEHREACRINTYTFGTPGTWDYEIGCQVAKALGTKHFAYDLTKYEFTFERLAQIADLSDGNTDVFSHAPYDWIVRDFGLTGVSFWMGFLGGSSVGSKIPNLEGLRTWGKRYCIERNRYARGIELESFLPGAPAELSVDLGGSQIGGTITKEELWNFENRQERYISPIVLLRGLQYVNPFADKEWLTYSLSIPLDGRRQQKIYKQILLSAFPQLINIPVKNNRGRPLHVSDSSPVQRAHRRIEWIQKRFFKIAPRNLGVNYIDFDAGFRYRKDLKNIGFLLLQNLQNRELLKGKAVEQLWKDHMNGILDQERSLTLLASFEIIMQVAEDVA